MILFADLAPSPVETTGSLCFALSLLVPLFAAMFYVMQRIFRGPGVLLEALDGDVSGYLTPIHEAAVAGEWEPIAAALAAGDAVDAPVADGVVEAGATALSLAAGSGHGEVVSLLLERGADPNTQDNRGRTPLHYASEIGDASVVGTLLAGGADPDRTDKGGASALFLARERGYAEVVTLLSARGAGS